MNLPQGIFLIYSFRRNQKDTYTSIMSPSFHAEYSIAIDVRVVAANLVDSVITVPDPLSGAGVVVGVEINGTIIYLTLPFNPFPRE